jgi:hypothetical protein
MMRVQYSPSGVKWLSGIGRQASTDESGTYRFSNLEPGQYYLAAKPGSTRAPFLTSFYPGVASAENAVAVTVVSGTETSGYEFSLVSGAQHTIRFAAPRPASVKEDVTPRFSLRPVSHGYLITPFSLSTAFEVLRDGVYRSPPVPPDSYLLDVIWDVNNRARATIEVVDKDVDAGILMPRKSGSVSGRILKRELPEDFNLSQSFFSLDDVEPEAGGVLVPPASRDGTFKLERVAEGRYVIAPSALLSRRDLYVASARLGSREVLGDILTLDGGTVQNLEITVAAGTGGIQGILHNARNEPVPFGRVVLIPPRLLRGNPHLFFSAVADHAGAFTLENVSPGDYDVLAWDYVEDFAYLNSDFLKRYEGQSAKVRVEPRSRQNLRVVAVEQVP